MESLENEIDRNSVILSTDQNFIYEGDTVEEGTNLLSLEDIAIEHGGTAVFAIFSEEVITKMNFTEETYTFTFEVTTTDGLEFDNSILLKFEIE